MIVEKRITQIQCPMWDSKRNLVRQLADVEANRDSCRKTEVKDLNSKEGECSSILEKLKWRDKSKDPH